MIVVIVETGGYVLDVDVEVTREYYRTLSLCECSGCRNFYAQAEERLPALTRFLSDMGVDINRPDELADYAADKERHYSCLAYTVVGTIARHGKKKIKLNDNSCDLKITIDNSYIPNEHKTDNYFTVTVYGVHLPWVLNEPFEEFAPNKNLIQRIKSLFGK